MCTVVMEILKVNKGGENMVKSKIRKYPDVWWKCRNEFRNKKCDSVEDCKEMYPNPEFVCHKN